MNKIAESHIEELAIQKLQQQGYDYCYGPDIAVDGANPLRENFIDVVLASKLSAAIDRINPLLSPDVKLDALQQVLRIHSPQLMTANQTFHRMLTEGVSVMVRQDGNERGELVKLIDFDAPENNDFCVVNQFTVIENHHNRRPDVVLFVNGLPLVVLELKNAVDENAIIHSAFDQLRTYKAEIPSLFTYNSIVIISDGLEAKAGTISSDFNRFMAWRTIDGKAEAPRLVSQLEVLIQGMLNKKTLLDLIHNFIVFESHKKTDTVTQIVSVETVKKLAAYHQYYAANKAVTM